jgi:hypothetical protein
MVSKYISWPFSLGPMGQLVIGHVLMLRSQNADRDCSSDPPSRSGANHGHRYPAVRFTSHRLEITQESLPPTPSSPLENIAETLRTHNSFEIDKVSFVDAVYEDATGQCLVDLGVQLGRMRLTERLGGYHHPKLVRHFPLKLTSLLISCSLFYRFRKLILCCV